MNKKPFQNFVRFLSLCSLFALISTGLQAQETSVSENPAAETPVSAAVETQPDPVVHETLRAYLQLQEQLHATRLALAESRQEMELATAQNALAFSNRLQALEQSMATRQAAEIEAMQSTNRIMLLTIGFFAVLGLMAILLMAYFQWRAIHRLGEVTANLPVRALGALPEVSALGLNDRQLTNGAVEQSNQRLLGFIERLEKRIAELEHSGPASLPEPERSRINGAGSSAGITTVTESDQVAMLFGKGQSLLYLNQAEEAIACFDEILSREPNHAEALIKKGSALEKLGRSQEAIACYDQAIAADNAMTIAYLYKGGLCNRMERFAEAMECYEQALRTQEKKRAA